MTSKEKLQDLFDSHLLYAFEKLRKGIQEPALAPTAEWGLETVSKVINEFKSRTTERGPGVPLAIEDAEQAARRLKAYFAGETPLDKEDALVYADHLQVQVNELEALAKEIDEGA